MNINSILPYYPTYEMLDNMVTEDKKFINLFIDLKACSTGFYVKDIISEILNSSEEMNRIDTSIFSSLLFMMIYHKKYALKKNKKIRFFIFSEMGDSLYHKKIFKEYKAKRKINRFYLLDVPSMDKFDLIVKKNILFMEDFLNKFPNIYYFNLRDLEADFIPYFLIKHTNVSKDDTYVNLIYSSDHDMKQCIALPNTKIYQRKRNVNNILSEGMAIESEIKSKSKKKHNHIDDKYFQLFLSIIGDISDEIPGIKGIGGATCAKIFPEIIESIGGIDIFEDKIFNGDDLFDDIHNDSIINLHKDLIIRNMKLISFNILSRKVLSDKKEYFARQKEYIISILKKDIILNSENVIDFMIKMSIDFFEDDVDILFS